MEIAKIQLSKNDIHTLQKGKHSVIDLDTSEPSDILTVKTDSSTEENVVVEQELEMTKTQKIDLMEPSFEEF